jgi:hypothetical protein
VSATRSDGTPLLVKVYGRDAADAALAERVWRSMWYRDQQHSLLADRATLAAHEALTMLACERDSIPTARAIGWSRSATDDIVLVAEAIDGPSLAQMTTDEIDDAVLARAWETLDKFHDHRIAVGEIDAGHLVMTDDGIAVVGLDSATLLATDEALQADRAQLLMTTATLVGDERAIEAARANLGDEGLAACLPVLQTAALPSSLQAEAKRTGTKAKALRSQIAARLGVGEPELARIHRVSWRSIATAALTLFAV